MRGSLVAAALVAGVLSIGADTARADIVIGMAGPLTGPTAAFGLQTRLGVEQAVADINAAGGVNGQTIRLQIEDDAGDARQGVSVANRLVGNNVKFVIGHNNSGVSIPASEVYAEAGVFQISPSSTSPTLTERGLWNVFRVCGRDDQQGLVAGRFLFENYKGKAVAIIHNKTAYGQGLADETRRHFNALGGAEVMYEGINVGEKDYTALVSKMKAANVAAFFLGGGYTEAGLIIRQLRDQGSDAQLIAGDEIFTTDFWSTAGPGAEGSLMTFSPDPRNIPSAAEAVAKIRALGREPEGFTLYGYAAVQIIAQAMEHLKSEDPRAVADLLHSGHIFNTVIGERSYDRKGDIAGLDYVLYKWHDGQYSELK